MKKIKKKKFIKELLNASEKMTQILKIPKMTKIYMKLFLI